MDFQSAMETFAEAWVAAKGHTISDISTQSQALALTRNCKSPIFSSGPGTTERVNRDSPDRGPTSPPSIPTPIDATVSPSSVKEEFDPSRNPSAKSLPVHCVVETVYTLDESRSLQHGVWRRRPLVETDRYVIIPVGTLFQNLVQAALLQLGYSQEIVYAARGSLLIKNWKSLTFDQISDDPMVTVGDILGEIANIATLKIQVFRARPGILTDVKDKLLKFMLLQSHSTLVNSGCPLDELTLSQIYRANSIGGGPMPEIPEDVRRKFEQWWNQFSAHSQAPRAQFPNTYSSQYNIPPPTIKTERTIPETSHPALQTVHNQFPTQKTRMRTSFDPELELPKLQRWFTENQHPSRQQIQQYVKELNNLESRRGRKPLDVNNVVYWFKNARAAQKRAEVRNITPGMSCSLPLNGYNHHSTSNGGFLMSDNYMNSDRMIEHRLKNNLTPRRNMLNSHTSDEFSNNGSDLEDDNTDVQPSSPIAPLSLTKKSISREESPRPSSSPPQPMPNIQNDTTKDEGNEEPLNYHSPTDDASNNNRVSLSDMEDEDVELENDIKPHFDNNSAASPLSIPHLKRFCGSPDESQLVPRIPNEGLERLGFPLVPNSMFSHSIMYMSHYIPNLSHAASSPSGSNPLNMSNLSADERRKRNRTFIDPVTEVPRLEQWFSLNTHPSHNLILKYTEELNCMTYRQKFPRLEPKNVQFWFKNRRAKCKRLKMSLFDSQVSGQYASERD